MIIVWPSSAADIVQPSGQPTTAALSGIGIYPALAGVLTASADIYQVYESTLAGPTTPTNVDVAQVYESTLAGPTVATLVEVAQVYYSILCTTAPPPPPPPSPPPFTCWPTNPTLNPPETQIRQSYLYVQYNDDDALQAFVAAYNNLAQQFLDLMSGLNLPVYPLVSRTLLDWVAAGLYGFPLRPTLTSGTLPILGAYNTVAYNVLPYGGQKRSGVLVYTPVSDNIFRRIIIWHFYKGDGFQFNIRWLKRRIARFLFASPLCLNPNIDQTNQISVTFGEGNIVYIDLIETIYRFMPLPYNSFPYGAKPYSGPLTAVGSSPSIALAQIFKDCMNGGFLEMPFQFQFFVNIVV